VDLERGTCNVLDPTPQQPWVLHRWRHAGCHVALVHCGGRGGAAAPPIDFRHARLQ
jgi:hypothetical protein